jgi:hypothetical protein
LQTEPPLHGADGCGASLFPALFPPALLLLPVPACSHYNTTHSYYYVELHQPYANDNTPDFKGIAVRLMGE